MLWVGFWLRKGFWLRRENGRNTVLLYSTHYKVVYFEKTACFYRTLLWRSTENK